MRIAVVGHHVAPIAPPFIGGVESQTWYLCRWLAENGHEPVLFALPGSSVPGVEVRELDCNPPLSAAARRDVSMPPEAFMTAHHAYQALLLELAEDADDFDVVHLQTLHYLPVAMADLLPAACLLTLHTPPTPWLESAIRARRGHRLCFNAVSDATARAWQPLRIAEVVPNGVAGSAWPAGPGGTAAVWCGRGVPEKAPHLAIDAARAAGLTVHLAGPIIDEAYWCREVQPRLGDDAVHVGHLDHHELAALLGSSAVALVTPEWDEPFGLTAAEAMATGTPVAAFARGGLPEVIGPDGGRLAAPGDVASLAAAAREAAALDRRTVRRSVLRRLGIDAMGRRYEALYERVAAGRHDALEVA